MSYSEETVDTKTIFEGRMIRLDKLTVRLPNGEQSTREVVRHPGAVAIIAEPSSGSVVLVKQFRKACEMELWEIPAGKLEQGEDPKDAAMRELAEETGLQAQELAHVYTFFTSPGFANEKLSVYYADKVTRGTANLDDDEFLDVFEFRRDEVQRMMENGQIQDAKTLVALLWWCQRQT